MSKIPQSEIDYQMAHKGQYSGSGLGAFMVVGFIATCTIVVLRIVSRLRYMKTGLHADDWTIIAAQILTTASTTCFFLTIYRYGYGYHMLTLPAWQELGYVKTDYAFNVFYTCGYPLSKISLTLLYRRVFILTWFNYACWFMVFVFSAYSFATIWVDIFLTIPINAHWNPTVKARHQVDTIKLYKANAWFNIATDAILFILPLTVIWRLQMSLWRRIGLSCVFAVGVLTVVTTIMRLVTFHQINDFDVTYTSTTLAFWTSGEQFLGIICACLPTLRPLFSRSWDSITRHSGSGSSSGSPSGPAGRGTRMTSVNAPGKTSTSSSNVAGLRSAGHSTRSLRPEAAAIDPHLAASTLHHSNGDSENAAALRALDPRATAAPGLGNRTDALYDERKETHALGGEKLRDEEQGPLPNAIHKATGYSVEDNAKS